MILKADFRCKQVALEVEACVVEKVVELSTAEFDQFCRSMLEKYPFIREARASLHYDDGMRHGFLVLGVGRNDGILVDTQGADYARYSAFIPNARSLLTPDMGIDRSYLSPAEPWRDESRDEMLRMTLRVEGKPDYTLVLPADEEYLDAVKNYLDIDVFTDAMLCDIRFKVPYIGELIRDTDCPAVEDYNDFAEALEDIWQKDGMLLTYAAVLEAEKPETLHRACELLRNLDNYRETSFAASHGSRYRTTVPHCSHPCWDGICSDTVCSVGLFCSATALYGFFVPYHASTQLDVLRQDAGHRPSYREAHCIGQRYHT